MPLRQCAGDYIGGAVFCHNILWKLHVCPTQVPCDLLLPHGCRLGMGGRRIHILRTDVFVHNLWMILWIHCKRTVLTIKEERYYLIYQEASDEECLLTIHPYEDVQALGEAIQQLQVKEVEEYTIIRGKKMNARLRLTVELTEAEEGGEQ